MTLTTGTILDRYEIISPIGAGGMGQVYLARDTQLDRLVAVKILPAEVAADEQRMQRFIQEGRATSALNHPNILTIHEIGQTDNTHYIATEFIEGVTLRHLIAGQPLKLADMLEIAAQIASALAAAHAAGIVHRDIKPENIMVRPDGYVKVLDFGLAKVSAPLAASKSSDSSDSEAPTRVFVSTDAATVMGTVNYMSPEQTQAQSLDTRTDIWSLGVVIYEMAAGRKPFAGATPSHVVVSILEKDPPPLRSFGREAPEELEWIVAKALAKDREERYQTAKELLNDLRRLKQRLEFAVQRERSTPTNPLGSELATPSGTTYTYAPSVEVSSGPREGARLKPRRRSRNAINSIAILPLVNANADPEVEYLSDGITESIINKLSQLPQLRVMARSTVFRYKGREVGPQEVGHDLNVRAVMTGRLLHIGQKLIVQTELVDTYDGSQLWGEQYNWDVADIFALQDEISKEISDKLRLRLNTEQKKRLTKRHTENTMAYQLHLKGRFYWNKRTDADLKKGAEYFQQAIAADPNYALAYAGLADSYIILGYYNYLSPQEAFAKAKAAAVKALDLDKGMAEAHNSLAFVRLLHDWDWTGAEVEFKQAIELNPGYATARHWYSEHLAAMGRFPEAIAEMERAYELDPLSLIINTLVGWVYYRVGDYDRAIRELCKTLEMDPNFVPAHLFLGWTYEQDRRFAEASAEYQQAIRISTANASAVAGLGRVYAATDRSEKAEEVLGELLDLSAQRFVSPYDIATLHAALGDNVRAFEWLNRACDQRSDMMVWLKIDPMLDRLRADSRFGELLQRVGLGQA
jgi:serine/threonine-protein kinase